jgi:2-polyprenyl-3-methyl-5-hydroxy-6-metoxy-1,4-benzoquinol methylase
MKQVFDEAADRFARSIDGAIRTGSYARGKLFMELCRSAFAAQGRVLDYGCGPGRLSILLAAAGFRVLGVDTSQRMIAKAESIDRDGLPVEFALISEAQQVLTPGAYDGIVCSSVIEYVADADGLLRAFRSALRDSGSLVISFANRTSLYRRHWSRLACPNPMGAARHHVWTWSEFCAQLTRSGFEPVMRPRYFEWPWDWRLAGSLLDRVPYLGSIGVVVARPMPLS